MDGAKAGYLYYAVVEMCIPQWVGGREGCCEARDASRSETAFSADLGGSSKYSNANFEDWSGERFHVNSDWTWVSRS